ncbi:hypothetical protein EHO58_09050 [Leptospira selangorensis]|uniref:hypothetical protein n=1 Tax=Leptospira selangorensis TaxID=2484982 RepID=UPI0010839D53|nr:hypothetical protein [Leptospira selangorensis]TGK05902.1 hypothetical protein EHO58_09050 [Leptospira selangorensis]
MMPVVVVFKMRFKLYKILILFLFLENCIGMRYGFETYYWHRTIDNFQNTYIKFNFISQKENETNIGGSENQFLYHLFVFFGDTNPLLGSPSSINPKGDYWKIYYSKFENLPYRLKSDIRFVFMEGCEYKMPTNVGKNLYRFSFGSERTQFSGKLQAEIDLPPNHSIRLSFKEKGIPYPDPQTFAERLENSRSANNRYEIIPTIEPTPNLDPIKPCEIKKD